MKKLLVIALTLVATPAASIELDDHYALARDGNTAICTTITALRKWRALASANRVQEALDMPECILLKKDGKVLIVDRDVAGYTHGIWTAPDGSKIDVWMNSYLNMTELDFAVFDCDTHRPTCTREVFEAVSKARPWHYGK